MSTDVTTRYDAAVRWTDNECLRHVSIEDIDHRYAVVYLEGYEDNESTAVLTYPSTVEAEHAAAWNMTRGRRIAGALDLDTLDANGYPRELDARWTISVVIEVAP